MIVVMNRIKNYFGNRKRLRDLKYHFKEFNLIYGYDEINKSWFGRRFGYKLTMLYDELNVEVIKFKELIDSVFEDE